jgi:transketolase
MNMREMFVKTTNEIVDNDKRVALILGGISVASFSESIEKYPERCFDAGISEQADLSIAAGMAISGMIPIFHTIAPFMAERAYEQLKIDFGYQKLGGNFISNGSSIDYSSFGATHQCPAEISVLSQIPNMQILVPGTPDEFRSLYLSTYDNGCPTYIRLSRDVNSESYDVKLGEANVIKKGKGLTIIAVGPMLKMVLEAAEDYDVTVLYYTSIHPFDSKTLIDNTDSGKVLVCEPYYEGALDYDITKALKREVLIDHCGMPHEFCKHYGTTKENYAEMGLTVENIKKKINSLL